MRYVIGMKIKQKETGIEKEYLCLVGDNSGFYTEEQIEEYFQESKSVYLLVFNSAEEAQKRVTQYAKNFRRKDVSEEEIWKKSKNITTFFPIKIDNQKFPYTVHEINRKTISGLPIYRLRPKERKEEK